MKTIDQLAIRATKTSQLLSEIQTSIMENTEGKSKLEALRAVQDAKEHIRDSYYKLGLMAGSSEEASIVAGII